MLFVVPRSLPLIAEAVHHRRTLHSRLEFAAEVDPSAGPVRLPDDAWIVLEGDRPREHMRDLVVAIFLVGFALVNLLAVRRAA